MRDEFAGNYNDYLKFGLLRYLCNAMRADAMNTSDEFMPGVVWYYTTDRLPGNAGGNGNGGNVDYLNAPDIYRPPNPQVFDALQHVVQHPPRTVAALEERTLLGNATIYFRDQVDHGDTHGQQARTERRNNWLRRALNATKPCHLVYLDPHTGIAPQDKQPYNAAAPRYAMLDELGYFLDHRDLPNLQVLCYYQHFGRNLPYDDQVEDWLGELGPLVQQDGRIFTLRAADQPFLFFVLAKSGQAQAVRGHLQAFGNTDLGRFFEALL